MIYAATTMQFTEPAAMNTVSRILCHPTDLMRRRVPLDLIATYLWHGVSLRIETNSQTILQAATDAGLMSVKDAHARSRSCWELTVEEDTAAPEPACAARAWRNGQSVYIEIAQRQWFAFDTVSGDGAGFLAAKAPALAARAYLEAIFRVLDPERQHRSGDAGCNG
jgi:hypothetical protein